MEVEALENRSSVSLVIVAAASLLLLLVGLHGRLIVCLAFRAAVPTPGAGGSVPVNCNQGPVMSPEETIVGSGGQVGNGTAGS